MPVFSFRTIKEPSDSIYKEKGSRFLGFAYPVSSENDVRDHLETLRKKYYDARHHCFAWTLGAEKKLVRASDDGEPNHSAGDPILGQIRSNDLTDVLVVVVRYFGGTKLGVGGLISAYKTAAAEALQRAIIIEKEVFEPVTLHYDYSATPEVMKLIKDFELTIIHQDFSGACVLKAEAKLKVRQELNDKIKLMRALGVKVEMVID